MSFPVLRTHARARVPHYRRLFDAHGLEPRHVRGVVDLGLIPITSRRMLQETGAEDLVANGIDAIAEEYRRFRPDVLSGSPSILLRLAQALPESERQTLRPRMIFSGGEVLTSEHRARIQEELGPRVRPATWKALRL